MRITRSALERLYLVGLELKRRIPWVPQEGPQTMAFESEADIIGFGGAAGGGKTDLACGKALRCHRRAAVFRRVGTEMQGIEDRFEELIGSKDGFNGQKRVWRRVRPDGVKQQIEFGSLPNLGDERGWQGRPHDLKVFDEAANFLEAQVRFLLGWLRTTHKGQRCQALLTFNPPTSAEGRWIIDFFAPWLDPKHPNPAKPGELRWFATLKGKDIEVPDARRFIFNDDGTRNYDFDPKDFRRERQVLVIRPKSRTFIPSKVTDNRFLMDTEYVSQLQALPEPLRSQMLNGDFMAGVQDDIWQVIPTAWVDAAMARWEEQRLAFNGVKPPMDSLGVDVARGGGDETTLAPRYGNWYDELDAHPGKETPDGHAVAGLVVARLRDRAVIHIDVIGVGASPYDILNVGHQTVGVNVAEKSLSTDRSGKLRFANLRSQLWWDMREALDPDNNQGVALPPDKRLRADLTAPRWELRGPIIKVEGRDEIIDRIGRSPDRASALILAQIDTPKVANLPGAHNRTKRGEYDPYSNMR